MSWNPDLFKDFPQDIDKASIETVLVPRARDIGGFEVRRALPAPQRQMVGPFIFFDQVGPVEFLTDQGIDVRPHPHIGLATITYLYAGEFRHMDSLGSDQMIYPGEVNWMIAGHGVTHSERTSPQTRAQGHNLFGIQTWVALPEQDEDMAPDFEHHGKGELPLWQDGGITARLIIGRAYGAQAPVKTFSDMFYLDVTLAPGAAIPLPDDHEDRGVHVAEGSVEVAGQVFNAGQMMIFRPGDKISLKAGEQGARILLLGGETLSGSRYIWWNFVATSREKIEQAKQDWAAQIDQQQIEQQAKAAQAEKMEHMRFPLPPDDRAEFIPLPEKS